jgi:hypothetical protein
VLAPLVSPPIIAPPRAHPAPPFPLRKNAQKPDRLSSAAQDRCDRPPQEREFLELGAMRPAI